MTENIPPGSADKPSAAAITSDSTARGLPYYEKLRRDLRDTLQKKRILDKNMAALEDSIYRAETSYLEETSPAGNIIKGFDNYIKSSAHSLAPSAAAATATTPAVAGGTISGSAAGGSGPATARSRKIVINETDRVFSRSSRGSYGGRDSETPSSATTTPGHAGMGETGGFGEKGQNGGGSGPQSIKGDNNKKKKKGSTAAASAGAGADESETDGKPNKRARISYGPRE